jgi:hypothetical protein
MKKAKTPERDELINGQILTYIGKGFIGYDKGNTLMKFIQTYENSSNDIWVEYIGMNGTIELIVGMNEIKVK